MHTFNDNLIYKIKCATVFLIELLRNACNDFNEILYAYSLDLSICDTFTEIL